MTTKNKSGPPFNTSEPEFSKYWEGLSNSQKVFCKYWEGFGIYLDNEGATFKKPTPKKQPKPYANWKLERKGANLTAHIRIQKNKKKQPLISVYIELNNYTHPTWFHKLHAQRAELERKLGFALDWQERPDKKSAEIRVSEDTDMREEIQHPKGYNWMLKHIDAIDRVFRPYIAALDDTPIDDS